MSEATQTEEIKATAQAAKPVEQSTAGQPEEIAEARQGLQDQYRNDAEGIKPMTQPKELQPSEVANEQSAAIEAQIAATKQQIAQIAKSRQETIGNMKPESNVFAPVLIGTGLAAGTAALADKMGNVAKAAQNFVADTAKQVIKDDKFDVAKKVTDTFKDNTELAETMKNAIVKENAPLINKEGIVEILGKHGDKINAKAGDIAKQVIKGDSKEIEKAVEKAFEEKGKGLFAKATIPAGSEQALTSAKQAVGNIAEFRHDLLHGEHVGELEGAFKEKMNGFAVGVVDKFNTTLPNIDPKIKLTALLVGTGLAIAAGHHVLTAGEREEHKKAEESVGKHTAAILAGQKQLEQLGAMRG